MLKLIYSCVIRTVTFLQGVPVARQCLVFLILASGKVLLSKQPPLFLVIERHVKKDWLVTALAALVGFKIMHCSRISRYFFSLHDFIRTAEDAKDVIRYFEKSSLRDDNETTCLIKALCYFSLGNAYEKKASKALEEAYERKLNKKSSAFFPSSAQEALEAVRKVLYEENGIKFFLCSGTLLAAVRNKKFFSWDYDIDIGVFDKDVSVAEVLRLFNKNKNFTKVRRYNDFLVKLTHKNGVTTDVFVHYSTGMFYAHSGGVKTWLNKKFRLKEISFCDKNYFAPEPVDRYLKENYGDYKKIPVFYDLLETCNITYADTFDARKENMLSFVGNLSVGNRFYAMLMKKIIKESVGFDVNVGKYIVPEMPEYFYMKHKRKS